MKLIIYFKTQLLFAELAYLDMMREHGHSGLMSYSCFKCNAEVSVTTNQQVGFKESCQRCASDLHACRNCIFYDISSYNECRETSAERVVDKEKANYCDYFKFAEGSSSRTKAQDDPRKKLDDLFK
jgi:hypothetical protein